MANLPRGKLLALVAIIAAVGLVTATGAFTSVTADRTVSIDTAGDANALLQLEGNSSSGGDAYVSTEGSPGRLVIDFSSGNLPNNAQGVNTNATTNVTHLITVTNNGQNAVDFYVNVGSTPSGVSLYFYNGTDTSNSVTGSGNSIPITSGNSASIGLSIDLGTNVNDFNATATFVANRQ